MTEADFNFGIALPTIAALRVQLRWLNDDDVPALFAIFGDPQVMRYWGHPALADDNAAASLLADIRALFAQRRLFQWGIALIETDAVIGTCTLGALDSKNRRAELGYALGRAHWGCGYADESLRALLAFAFSRMRLHRLTADTDPRNQASIKTLERLGFRREGYLREHHLTQDEVQDSIIYGLLVSEWQAQFSASSSDSVSRQPKLP
jgi:[ribosomal protein S5]-alanine N-acetyltransferase